MNGVENNYKQYQGQEYTEDLGLNIHEWKYRISDPAIGRFWQIDPLATKYPYNSTYAFQENKMGIGVELEGLEVTGFPTPGGVLKVEAKKATAALGGILDKAGGFIKGFFTSSTVLNSNPATTTTLNHTESVTARTNFSEFLKDSNGDNKPDGNMFTVERTSKTTINTTSSAQATVEGVTGKVKTETTSNVETGETNFNVKTEATMGVENANAGLFMNTKNSTDGSTTVTAGAQVNVQTPEVSGTTFKLGIQIGTEQEIKD